MRINRRLRTAAGVGLVAALGLGLANEAIAEYIPKNVYIPKKEDKELVEETDLEKRPEGRELKREDYTPQHRRKDEPKNRREEHRRRELGHKSKPYDPDYQTSRGEPFASSTLTSKGAYVYALPGFFNLDENIADDQFGGDWQIKLGGGFRSTWIDAGIFYNRFASFGNTFEMVDEGGVVGESEKQINKLLARRVGGEIAVKLRDRKWNTYPFLRVGGESINVERVLDDEGASRGWWRRFWSGSHTGINAHTSGIFYGGGIEHSFVSPARRNGIYEHPGIAAGWEVLYHPKVKFELDDNRERLGGLGVNIYLKGLF